MHTLSSASRTCMASASAVECTATTGVPSSLQARRTRSASSPRLAMRILSNMTWALAHVMAGLVPAIHDLFDKKDVDARPKAGHDDGEVFGLASFDDHQRFAVFDRLTVLEQDLRHRAGAR